MKTSLNSLVFNISCLLFIKNKFEKLLLLKRSKHPNKGYWSPPGGKLNMNVGESPIECAVREAKEETGLDLEQDDLRIFGYVSEKGYEKTGHWLMFLIESHKKIDSLPKSFEEGSFCFFDQDEIQDLSIPPSDHDLVWPFYKKRELGFWGVNAEWKDNSVKIKIEESPV